MLSLSMKTFEDSDDFKSSVCFFALGVEAMRMTLVRYDKETNEILVLIERRDRDPVLKTYFLGATVIYDMRLDKLKFRMKFSFKYSDCGIIRLSIDCAEFITVFRLAVLDINSTNVLQTDKVRRVEHRRSKFKPKNRDHAILMQRVLVRLGTRFKVDSKGIISWKTNYITQNELLPTTRMTLLGHASS